MKAIQFLCIALITVFVAQTALAQRPNCWPAAGAFEQLADKFRERPVFRGLDRAGRRIVLTMSRNGGWTLLMLIEDRSGNPSACITKSGSAGKTFFGEAA